MDQRTPEVRVTDVDDTEIKSHPLQNNIPPKPNKNPDNSLDDFLRSNLNQHPCGRNKSFLTLGCLWRLLPATRVQEHLEKLFREAQKASYTPLKSNCNHYLDLICLIDQPTDNSPETGRRTYIRLFATLILADKGSDVFKFIDSGISDETLPISEDNKPPCMQGWEKLRYFDDFNRWQWRMKVPYLRYGEHRQFDAQVVLPYIPKPNCEDNNRLGVQIPFTPFKEAGGQGEVSSVAIHSECHNFYDIPDLALQLPGREGPFALKRLIGSSPAKVEQEFRKELYMLKTFNGMVHPHIVSILTSFRHGSSYYLLFPCAVFDLAKYFEERAPTDRTKTARWVSKQCLGLMEAVHKIHFPPKLDTLQPEDKLFGRHGDIKAENVLVFISHEGEENLVLSDFGLGSMHHDQSKSNIPNREISATPGFRPPECDMENGKISRSFDVWTLGCLFLDLLTWLLGGEDLRSEFDRTRMTPYIDGRDTDIYFEIVATEGKSNEPGYIVKEQVTNWIDEMHRHENCTKFVHEFLDIIEKRMLIVETNVMKRARTGELKEILKTFHDRCQSPDAEADYLYSNPRRSALVIRTLPIAKGPLNENAMRSITRSGIKLRKVTGTTEKAEPAQD